jgi:hypothetical protein
MNAAVVVALVLAAQGGEAFSPIVPVAWRKDTRDRRYGTVTGTLCARVYAIDRRGCLIVRQYLPLRRTLRIRRVSAIYDRNLVPRDLAWARTRLASLGQDRIMVVVVGLPANDEDRIPPHVILWDESKATAEPWLTTTGSR